jgi:hypothetical protein
MDGSKCPDHSIKAPSLWWSFLCVNEGPESAIGHSPDTENPAGYGLIKIHTTSVYKLLIIFPAYSTVLFIQYF